MSIRDLTARYVAEKAYDQGVEDGIRQERERIREALLDTELEVDALIRNAWGKGYIPDAHDVVTAALDHIGLGEETDHE